MYFLLEIVVVHFSSNSIYIFVGEAKQSKMLIILHENIRIRSNITLRLQQFICHIFSNCDIFDGPGKLYTIVKKGRIEGPGSVDLKISKVLTLNENPLPVLNPNNINVEASATAALVVFETG